jgi:hypothetical protein
MRDTLLPSIVSAYWRPADMEQDSLHSPDRCSGNCIHGQGSHQMQPSPLPSGTEGHRVCLFFLRTNRERFTQALGWSSGVRSRVAS